MSLIRWNLTNAAREFDIHRQTLEKRIVSSGAGPGEDGCWSTKQVVRAIYGDEETERLRKVTAEADLLEARRKVIERDYVPTENVLKCWEFIIVTFRQKILNCPELSPHRRNEILEELRSINPDEYFRDMAATVAADEETA